MLALAAFLAAAVPVPVEVADYYRDHNFVSAFSTVGERQLVAEGRQASVDRRLTRVGAAMKRLARRIEDVDPGIVHPRAPAAEAVLREDLLRVTSFEGGESAGEAWVRLEALRLDRPGRLMLISRFEELAADRRPSVDDLVVAGGRSLVATEEIHRWVWIDGEWRRDRATRHFLGYSPLP
jgi:hypothetical protein